jgi:signal transduction histidine kinase
VEDLVSSGRAEAERIAEQLGEDGLSELQVTRRRREELVLTLAGLPQRRIIESIEVTDANGEVVFTSDFRANEALPEELAAPLELTGQLDDRGVRETETSYQVTAPLGEVGEVVLNISKRRLAGRVMELRRELLGQTVAVGVLTLLTLVVAFVFVWSLVQRTRRLETQRREAQELAALGALAANLAHEIRNPLNSINLNLEMLEEDMGDGGSEAASSLVATRREVGRLARLVSDFLTYARPSQPAMDVVGVRRLLRDTSEFIRGEARAQGVRVTLGGPIQEVEVRGDEGQLRQVLLNLTLNAMQAVAELDEERRVVSLGFDGGAEQVRVWVRDQGEGVPPEELDRVRQAFVTRRRGGTGLGLAIAERIAVAHGGRMELGNLEPTGFEAAIVLPIACRDGKMSGLEAEPAPVGTPRSGRPVGAETGPGGG